MEKGGWRRKERSSGSLSVFPEKERRPRGEEDEKGSIAEQRGKSRWKTRGKRGYVALALVTKGEREREGGERGRERGKSRDSSQSSDRRAWNKTQLSPSKSNFRRAVTWKTFSG